ncbi:MAG: TIGR03960 family B12-binding radical SAM protein [Coriobacteriia bacterium]|nr:TIGR03960 family B12-binding radical SAM protein [Coriobacteriia bacterium]MCL2745485.1 TIGR03960 family B12-binding radical SAM protein [Coriobacteriia bacterium]MCL2871202.1 TIGR03960 family B12-binding radical SAM protein [Coriobacteriia bacterium]
MNKAHIDKDTQQAAPPARSSAKAYDSLWPRIEPLLAQVERPSRYINGEYGAVQPVPEHLSAQLNMGLCYPASYELGQSNQALHILYDQVNQLEGVRAQRTFLPGKDLSILMRGQQPQIPLFTLEEYVAVKDLDILGITLPYELIFPAVLEILDLSGLPLRAADRVEGMPLVIVGGPASYNPEPLAPFVDAVFLGEADGGALHDVLTTLRDMKKQENLNGRQRQLEALAQISGVYVPALYDARKQQGPIVRRAAQDFHSADFTPVCLLVPYAEPIHDRLTVEVRRGCTRGCRFCQAGITYRPVRERSADSIVAAAISGIERTGFNEVSLTSLSTTDYSLIEEVLQRLKRRFAGRGVSVSIPSLRVDNFSIDLARILADKGTGSSKKSSLTFAPEAGSQRLRDVINKGVDEQQLLDTVAYAFQNGWHRMKLYFMIGLPTETDEDVAAIGELVNKVLHTARQSAEPSKRGGIQISVSVSTFVPKAHTPFQWEHQLLPEETLRRQKILQDSIPRKGIKLSWHDAEGSFVEGLIARGGRGLAPLIEEVWSSSQGKIAYVDNFDFSYWQIAADNLGINLESLINATTDPVKPLPWDHLQTGVSVDWLHEEAAAALTGQFTPDCATDACSNCDACDNLDVDVRLASHLTSDPQLVAAKRNSSEQIDNRESDVA